MSDEMWMTPLSMDEVTEELVAAARQFKAALDSFPNSDRLMVMVENVTITNTSPLTMMRQVANYGWCITITRKTEEEVIAEIQ